MDPRVAVPSDFDSLPADASTKLADPLLVHRERLIEEGDGAHLMVILEVTQFPEDVLCRPVLPRRLRDGTE